MLDFDHHVRLQNPECCPPDRPLLVVPSFWVAASFSGLLGLSISFSSLWFLHQTSPTTYRYAAYALFIDSLFHDFPRCFSNCVFELLEKQGS